MSWVPLFRVHRGQTLTDAHTSSTNVTLLPATAPATPATNQVVLYNEGGVLKAKTDDGNVTTIAGRTP